MNVELNVEGIQLFIYGLFPVYILFMSFMGYRYKCCVHSLGYGFAKTVPRMRLLIKKTYYFIKLKKCFNFVAVYESKGVKVELMSYRDTVASTPLPPLILEGELRLKMDFLKVEDYETD